MHAPRDCGVVVAGHIAVVEVNVRRIPTRTAVVGLCAAFCMVTLSLPADARGKRGNGDACIPNVQGWLTEGGVDLATVDTIEVRANVRRNNDGDSRFQNWQVWVRFKDREGTINFSLQRDCQLMHSWSSDEIAWEGPGAKC